ncbi:hypothetical protein [Paracoccus salsus]|uniref:hypothetical protein n=1 Tax=Paracoccus salsus TaxID=2911061 RepID=UPI003F6DC4EE
MATSGDYRHGVELRGRRLSHSMDPKRSADRFAGLGHGRGPQRCPGRCPGDRAHGSWR